MAQANVKIHIATETTSLDNQLVGAYWSGVIKMVAGDTVMARELSQTKEPQVVDNQVQLTLENAKVAEFVQRRLLGLIETGYQEVGFPAFRIKTFVDEDASVAKREAIQAKQEAAEQKLMAQAMQQIQQQVLIRGTFRRV